MNCHLIRTQPHDQFIETQSHDTEYDKDGKVSLLAVILIDIKHPLHTGNIVEYRGYRKRQNIGNQYRNVADAMEEPQTSEVNQKCDAADNTETEHLFNQFLHGLFVQKILIPFIDRLQSEFEFSSFFVVGRRKDQTGEE